MRQVLCTQMERKYSIFAVCITDVLTPIYWIQELAFHTLTLRVWKNGIRYEMSSCDLGSHSPWIIRSTRMAGGESRKSRSSFSATDLNPSSEASRSPCDKSRISSKNTNLQNPHTQTWPSRANASSYKHNLPVGRQTTIAKVLLPEVSSPLGSSLEDDHLQPRAHRVRSHTQSNTEEDCYVDRWVLLVPQAEILVECKNLLSHLFSGT